MEKQQKDYKFEYILYKSLKNIIPEVPSDLKDKLRLNCCSLGGWGRDELPEDYIEEHQKAFNICRDRMNIINNIQDYLFQLEKENLEMIGCLRNTYKPPYDPESFIDAWVYSHVVIKGQDAKYYYNDIKKFDKEKLKKSYDFWVNVFYKITHGIDSGIKYFGQWENRSKGYIAFYVCGYIGEFHVTFPQNILKDYGTRDELNDMCMSISYSAPGDGNVCLKCLNYKLVCKAYSFEELNKLFFEKLIHDPMFKTRKDYIAKYELDFQNYINNKEFEKKQGYVSDYEKDLHDTLISQMKDFKCDVIETPRFKEILNHMLETIKKETYGEIKK